MFEVGDKVVYIESTNSMSVVKGSTYTIRTCFPNIHYGYGVTLEEVNNEPDYVGFKAFRFRKIEKKPLFTNALTKELANTPIIEEKVEKARELETV